MRTSTQRMHCDREVAQPWLLRRIEADDFNIMTARSQNNRRLFDRLERPASRRIKRVNRPKYFHPENGKATQCSL